MRGKVHLATRRRRLSPAALALGLVLPALAAEPALAGEEPPERRAPEILLPLRHDLSPELRRAPAPTVPFSGFQMEVNPLRPAPTRPERRAPTPTAPDPAVQLEARPIPAAAATPGPLLSVPGLSDDDNAAVWGFRIAPPDTQGDIGPNHYVQWINSIFAVWDVTRDPDGTPNGATLDAVFGIRTGNSIWSGFGGFCETNNDGDPIVLYDHLADRWFLSQFSIDEGIQCIAVSTTPDPTGSYFRYAYSVSPGQNNDYPKFGLMPEAYYLSLRDFPVGATFASAVAFDRLALLAGAPSPAAVKFSLPCAAGNCPDGIQPPHLEGPAPPFATTGIFTRAWDDDLDGPLPSASGADGYRLWEFDPDFSSPPSSTFTELPFVPGTPFDSNLCGLFVRNCIPQSSAEQLLDPVDELQMYRAQYRHFTGSHDGIVLNTTVDAGGDRAGIRWAELRNSGAGWTLHQDGTYAPGDGLGRFMGSAAMDSAGQIALGYSVSGSTLDPSIRYTTRQAGDPAGTLPGGEVTLVAGSGAQLQSNRWGDYSAMSVDPASDCTFWYTQEYYENTAGFDFKSRIGAWKMPECGGVPCVEDADCDDSVACTDDSCNPATRFCEFVPNHANCDDGAFCNGAEYCDPEADCQPGGPVCFSPQTCNEVTDMCEGCADDMVIFGPQTIDGPDTRTARFTIGTSGEVTVAAGGDLELTAGVRVSFDNDFTVEAGGLLTVDLVAEPCP